MWHAGFEVKLRVTADRSLESDALRDPGSY